jgi:hypothetical protein
MKVVLENSIIRGFIGVGIVAIGITTFSTDLSRSRTDSIAPPQICSSIIKAKPFARTELFFGLSKPDGTEVNSAEFQRFLDREVTPRFPDGFTVLTGYGQFKNAHGAVIKERSNLLILLYPIGTNSNQQIDRIRKAYTTAFQQQSVLRADELSCAAF